MPFVTIYSLYVENCKGCKVLTDNNQNKFSPISLLHLATKQVIVNNKKCEFDAIKCSALKFQLEKLTFAQQNKTTDSVATIKTGTELIETDIVKNSIIKLYCECRFPMCHSCYWFKNNQKLNSHSCDCTNKYLYTT